LAGESSLRTDGSSVLGRLRAYSTGDAGQSFHAECAVEGNGLDFRAAIESSAALRSRLASGRDLKPVPE